MQSFLRPLTLAVALGLAASCSTTKQNVGLGHVDQLTTRIGALEADLAVSRTSVHAAQQVLRSLVNQDFSDADEALRTLVERANECANQAAVLRKRVGPMQSSAEKYFSMWAKSMEDFVNPRLRERSEDRLEGSRLRFDDIVAAMATVHADFDTFNASLNDHALFIGYDFSAGGLDEVKQDLDTFDKQTGQLLRSIDVARETAEDYVRTATPPIRK
jgi:hypothetical protein